MSNHPQESELAERKYPLAVRATFFALALGVVELGIRFIGAVSKANAESSPATVVLVIFSTVLSVAFYALGFAAVLRGWKVAPFLVTLIALWGMGEVLSYGDPLSIVAVVAGVLMTIAVWLPASRAYASNVGAQRSALDDPKNPVG